MSTEAETPTLLPSIHSTHSIDDPEFVETVDDSSIEPPKVTSNADKLQALGMISTLSSSAEDRIERASFVHYRDTIEEGDTVIIYVNATTLKSIKVQRGRTLNMKHGALRHEFLIGKRYGSKVSATAGSVFALRPNPVLWTRTLRRFTQILYQHDIATIIYLLDIKPGSVICESGTGSGSLTHALSVAVGRNGHVYTHDVEEIRVKSVEQDLAEHGVGEWVTCVLQDVCEDGFFVTNACDGVFLDLPTPWKAVEHAKNAISRARGGRLVSFSPCIEQCVQTVEELRKHKFQLVQIIEIVPRELKATTQRQKTLEFLAEEPLFKRQRGRYDDRRQGAAGTGGCDSFPVSSTSVVTNSENLNDNSIATTSTSEITVQQSDAVAVPKPVAPAIQKFHLKRKLVPSPVVQPSHSGYLVSATYFPNLE